MDKMTNQWFIPFINGYIRPSEGDKQSMRGDVITKGFPLSSIDQYEKCFHEYERQQGSAKTWSKPWSMW